MEPKRGRKRQVRESKYENYFDYHIFTTECLHFWCDLNFLLLEGNFENAIIIKLAYICTFVCVCLSCFYSNTR